MLEKILQTQAFYPAISNKLHSNHGTSINAMIQFRENFSGWGWVFTVANLGVMLNLIGIKNYLKSK